MARLIFCFAVRRTGMNVSHWVDDDAPGWEDPLYYDAVPCPACALLHFINRSTGKLLGDKKTSLA
jgi:hypothetical protein